MVKFGVTRLDINVAFVECCAVMQRRILHVYWCGPMCPWMSTLSYSIKSGSMLSRGGRSKQCAHVGTTLISHDVTQTHKQTKTRGSYHALPTLWSPNKSLFQGACGLFCPGKGVCSWLSTAAARLRNVCLCQNSVANGIKKQSIPVTVWGIRWTCLTWSLDLSSFWLVLVCT